MLKFINKFVAFSYNKPKVLNIASLLKKQGDNRNEAGKLFGNIGREIKKQIKSDSQVNLGDTFKTNLKAKQVHNDDISIKQLQRTINAKDDGMDRIQLQINHQIKIEVKESNLYQLYRSKKPAFSPKNLINLLIKLLELRYINQAVPEQSAQFDKMLLLITKKINKMSPQDMIRFLFSFKKVEMNHFDLKRMHGFISLILEQFTSRSVIKGYQTDKQYQAFEVISIQSSLKLLHSLVHLHFISGSQFEPTIVQLIKKSLNYFHVIVKNYLTKTDWQGAGRKIKWHFYFSFVSLSVKYQMPLQMIVDFLKALYPFKMSFMNKHQLLVDVSESLNELQRIRVSRGQNIKEIKELFYVYQIIYENLEKPQQMLKMRPTTILSHLKNLSYFSEEELNLLGFKQIKEKSLLKILQFTVKTYHKYYCKDYQTQLQKSSYEAWINEANKSHKQYLGQLLLQFHGYLLNGSFTNISEFNKLINVCLQWYSQLSFNAKSVLFFISLERKFTNTKVIAEIYFNRQNAIIKQTKQFKKYQQLQSYIRLFGYWPQIKQISKQSFDLYLEGTFIKLFFNAIIHIPNLQLIAERFTYRIAIDKEFYKLLLKKYFKFSTENRSLSKNFIGLVQEAAFKRELNQLQVTIKNESEDTDRLSRYVRVKYRLRQKLKRSLTIFKFYILLFQGLNQREVNKIENITILPDFVKINTEFNDELMCLNFKQLFTLQIYALASQISLYLQKKMVNCEYCRVNDICNRKKELNVQIIVPKGLGCLKYIEEGSKKQSKELK